MKKVGVVRDDIFLEHIKDSGHIESPRRLIAIYAMLDSIEMKDKWVDVPARLALKEELAWNHDMNYINMIEKTRERDYTQLDPDTMTNEKSWEAACKAVGGGFALIDEIMKGRITYGFLLCRPPGHHALHHRAMGFCLFNNVALGAYYLINRYNLSRIAILDWDLHHGNGTQDSFYGDDRVLFISLHQYPHYPGSGRIEQTGKDRGEYYTLNIPLPAGCGDEDYAFFFNRVIRPVLLEFKPEFILVSAGFDIFKLDPLGGMRISEKGFAYMTNVLMDVARITCNNRLAFYLEGGYNLDGLSLGVKATILELNNASILSGDELEYFKGINTNSLGVYNRILEVHGNRWKSLYS